MKQRIEQLEAEIKKQKQDQEKEKAAEARQQTPAVATGIGDGRGGGEQQCRQQPVAGQFLEALDPRRQTAGRPSDDGFTDAAAGIGI